MTHFRSGIALALALSALAGGCSSTTEDPGTGAINTGAYPNLNIKPGVAADQFTPQERVATGAQLKATQAAAVSSGGAAPANEQARLSGLAQTHGKKTLDQIQKEACGTRPKCP